MKAQWETARSVHPHGRGERRRYNNAGCGRAGSSPRAWGTLKKDREDVEAQRFIPTGVGNACCCSPANRTSAVHPHGRGERL